MQGQWAPADGGRYQVVRPDMKSKHLMGGIGTLRLGVTAEGWRLGSVSEIVPGGWLAAGPLSGQSVPEHGNASAGIPLLMPDDLWSHLALEEGAVIDLLDLPWRSLPGAWSAFFPSIKDLPRGCLVVERAEQITSAGRKVPSAVHPFSVMQYDSADGPRLDFVYAQGIANSAGWREEVQGFFAWYCQAEGRAGRLILGADLVDPMWDAQYGDPAALRAADPNDVALLEARALGTDLKDRLIDLLQGWLVAAAGDGTVLDVLGRDIALPPGWQVGGAISDRVSAILAASVRSGKLAALYDAAQHQGLQPRQPFSAQDLVEVDRLAPASSAALAVAAS
jgi:hypothetical protein